MFIFFMIYDLCLIQWKEQIMRHFAHLKSYVDYINHKKCVKMKIKIQHKHKHKYNSIYKVPCPI